MAITLHFAEKSGTKELAHDLHFQAPKYETTHVVVRPKHVPQLTLFRNSQNLHRDFLNFWLNQERHQDILLRLQRLRFHRQQPLLLHHPSKKARNVN